MVLRDFGASCVRRLRVLPRFSVPGCRVRISGFPYVLRGASVATIGAVAERVLVVDDDAGFRGLAVRLLARAGLRVVGEADTATRARELAHEVRPTSVLLDVSLPDGDGMTLASELVQLSWRPRVILISTDRDAISSHGLDQSGAAAFIPKDELTDAALRVAFAVA